jgi:hypothetical protein
MEFVNLSGLPAGWTLGFDQEGRELLVVVAKATYKIPSQDQEPLLAEEQCELVKADEFTGEPGYSATLHETDYSPRKLKCDVVLNGSAYAPHGRPAKAVEVSLLVASMRKSFWVFGDRRWQDFLLPPSGPEPFVQTKISYDRAYGGFDRNEDEPDKVATYAENPVGTGYHPIRRASALVGELLANSAERRQPISDITGRFKPMSFGPVGRNFLSRYKHAGTYDQKWLEERAPIWPTDFSYAYCQCAPDDQQVPFLQGGEPVELVNLSSEEVLRFEVPSRKVPVICVARNQQDVETLCVCDTFFIEPDLGRFSMTWRASIPLRRNLFELKQVVVGELPRSWYSKRRAERAGKTYYASLAEAVASRRPGGRP